MKPVVHHTKLSVWLPTVVAGFLALAGVTEVWSRGPAIGRAEAAVLAERIVATPVPQVVETPAPPPLVEATPVPVTAPRVRAPGSGRRTSGPRIVAPVLTKGWVQIPSIKTNAPVVRVGLDQNGNMQTPKNANDIAWLDAGSFPGPSRNAILAGHRNWKGKAGSLMHLEHAKVGDVVRVALDGKTYTFSIVWLRQVDPDNANVDEILGPTSVDSVTLVTCGGQFNRSTRHYEERVVARAELVSIE